MLNTKPMLTLFRSSFCLLAAVSSLFLAGCAHDLPAPPVLSRDLPQLPDRLFKAPPVPALDTQCRFPWFGISGCKGKDPSAMLRLTVSHDQEQGARLTGSAGWYEGVRISYRGK